MSASSNRRSQQTYRIIASNSLVIKMLTKGRYNEQTFQNEGVAYGPTTAMVFVGSGESTGSVLFRFTAMMTEAPATLRARTRCGWLSITEVFMCECGCAPRSNSPSRMRLPPSRVGQHAAIGMATEAVQPPGARTRVRKSRASAESSCSIETCPEPGGSACCCWNGCGAQCDHPARGLTVLFASALLSAFI